MNCLCCQVCRNHSKHFLLTFENLDLPMLSPCDLRCVVYLSSFPESMSS